MANKKKYYKTIVTVTVLSEDQPVHDGTDLDAIYEEITNGPWSGHIDVGQVVQLTGKQMADALMAQGSDSEFFGLTPEGEEIDYDERREEAENN